MLKKMISMQMIDREREKETMSIKNSMEKDFHFFYYLE